MYYTKDKFVKGSKEEGPNITTGYIDRQVYIDNPLTHQDLKTYLDSVRPLNPVETNIKNQGMKISDVYFSKIYHLLREVFESFIGKVCSKAKDDSIGRRNSFSDDRSSAKAKGRLVATFRFVFLE
jgi:hypothetical protein